MLRYIGDIKINNENIVIGMMFAFAKNRDWEAVDRTLQELDEELWLQTGEFESMQDFKEFIDNNYGVSLWQV